MPTRSLPTFMPTHLPREDLPLGTQTMHLYCALKSQCSSRGNLDWMPDSRSGCFDGTREESLDCQTGPKMDNCHLDVLPFKDRVSPDRQCGLNIEEPKLVSGEINSLILPAIYVSPLHSTSRVRWLIFVLGIWVRLFYQVLKIFPYGTSIPPTSTAVGAWS